MFRINGLAFNKLEIKTKQIAINYFPYKLKFDKSFENKCIFLYVLDAVGENMVIKSISFDLDTLEKNGVVLYSESNSGASNVMYLAIGY